jgi:hypothetical protein
VVRGCGGGGGGGGAAATQPGSPSAWLRLRARALAAAFRLVTYRLAVRAAAEAGTERKLAAGDGGRAPVFPGDPAVLAPEANLLQHLCVCATR